VRGDAMKELVFTGRLLPASEGAALGPVIRLSDTPVHEVWSQLTDGPATAS